MSEWGHTQLWVLQENKCSPILSTAKLLEDDNRIRTLTIFNKYLHFIEEKEILNSDVKAKVTSRPHGGQR